MSSYTLVTQTSWFSRIKSALAGIILGPLCIFLAIWLLWYNEGRSVERAEDLKYGIKVVQEVSPETYNPSFDTKLIHFSAPITGRQISDATFGVQVSGALLTREVEMYQWKENESSQTKENLGGSTTTTKTYNYEKVWSSSLIQSSGFAEQGKYNNPTSFLYPGERFLDKDFKVGSYTLSQNLIDSLPTGKEVPLSDQNLILGTGMLVQNNTIFIGANIQQPQIGDMKVHYTALQDGEVISIIAGQNKDAVLSPYQAKNKSLSRLSLGTLTAAEMFSQMQTENTLLTWGLRFAGLLLMFIGWGLFFSIISILGAFIPFLGNILGFGTSFIALILTLSLGGIVIIFAWIMVRPLFAILGAILLIALLYVLWQKKHKKISQELYDGSYSQ